MRGGRGNGVSVTSWQYVVGWAAIAVGLIALFQSRWVVGAWGAQNAGAATAMVLAMAVYFNPFYVAAPTALRVGIWAAMAVAVGWLLRSGWLEEAIGAQGIGVLVVVLLWFPVTWVPEPEDHAPPTATVDPRPPALAVTGSAALWVVLAVLAPTAEACGQVLSMGGIMGLGPVVVRTLPRPHARKLLARVWADRAKTDVAQELIAYRWASSWIPEVLAAHPEVWAWGVGVLLRSERYWQAMKAFRAGLGDHAQRPEALEALGYARRAAVAEGDPEGEAKLLRWVAEKYPETEVGRVAAEMSG